jgi:predicted MFS family arabinose efflux permease
MLVSSLFYLFFFAFPGFAPGLALLILALFLTGGANGAMDVSMNAHADAIERAGGRPVMTACHAMFSLGLALGAVPAGFIAAAGIAPGPHLLAVGALLAGPMLLIRNVFPRDGRTIGGGPHFALPRGPLLWFGALCFTAALAEGSMNDWATVYYRESLGAGPVTTAAAFSVFGGAMFVGRLFGDDIIGWLGSYLVARGGMLLAATGFALTLGSGDPVVGVLGLAAVGLGVSCVFPIVFRAAAQLPGHAPGPAMAAAVTLGYGGFLLGPVAIGLVAEATALPVALWMIVAALAAGALLAGSLREHSGSPGRPESDPPR